MHELSEAHMRIPFHLIAAIAIGVAVSVDSMARERGFDGSLREYREDLDFPEVDPTAVDPIFSELSTPELAVYETAAQELEALYSNVLRSTLVHIDPAALKTDHREERCVIKYGEVTCFDWCLGSKSIFNAFADSELTLVNDRVRQTHVGTPSPSWTWIGRIEEDPNSIVLLTFNDETKQLLGEVNSRQRSFRIEPLTGSVHWVAEIDPVPSGGPLDEDATKALNGVPQGPRVPTYEYLNKHAKTGGPNKAESDRLLSIVGRASQLAGGEPKGGAGSPTIDVFGYSLANVSAPAQRTDQGIAKMDTVLSNSGFGFSMNFRRVGPAR